MSDSRTYYPIFLDLSGRTCVVVGGGTVGEQKVRGLLDAGARVVLISPKVTEGLADLAGSGRIELVLRAFQRGDLEGAALAFAATDCADANRAVAGEAEAGGVLLNAAADPVAGDFILPSVFRRGPLRVALSTGGGSPAYAKMVRERLEEIFGPEHGELVDFLERLRPHVVARFPNSAGRRRAVWGWLVTWETVELVRQRRWDQIEEMVAECLS